MISSFFQPIFSFQLSPKNLPKIEKIPSMSSPNFLIPSSHLHHLRSSSKLSSSSSFSNTHECEMKNCAHISSLVTSSLVLQSTERHARGRRVGVRTLRSLFAASACNIYHLGSLKSVFVPCASGGELNYCNNIFQPIYWLLSELRQCDGRRQNEGVFPGVIGFTWITLASRGCITFDPLQALNPSWVWSDELSKMKNSQNRNNASSTIH